MRSAAGEGCGVAVMMSQHREDSAQLMLSHAWAEDVEVRIVDHSTKALGVPIRGHGIREGASRAKSLGWS